MGGGYVLKSEDGIVWEQSYYNDAIDITSICYSDNIDKFCITYGNGIMKSSDGTTWETAYTGEDIVSDIIYADNLGITIAVSYNKVIVSSDGITWTEAETSFGDINSLIYSDSLNKILGVSSNGLYESYDGTNWNLVTAIDGTAKSITYNVEDGYYYICCNESVLRSNDAISWDSEILTISTEFNSVAYSKEDNFFLALSNGKVYKSIDGHVWQNIKSRNGHSLMYHTYLKKFYMANNNYIYDSTDGVNWNGHNIGVNLQCIFQESEDNTFLIGVGSVSGKGAIYSSIDGINWNENYRTENNTTINSIWMRSGLPQDMVSGIAVGGGIVYALTASNWQEISISGISGLIGVIYSDMANMWIAVAGYKKIITSYDGINWQVRTLNFTRNYEYGIAYSKDTGLIVILGSGECAISSDGINWIIKSFYREFSYDDIKYSAKLKKFYFVGRFGTFFISNQTLGNNLIQNLSVDSDMQFDLRVGENDIILNKDSGSCSGVIRYRQKYIGV